MQNMTDYLKNKVLDDNLVNVYVGLYVNDDELAKPSYKRMPIIFNDAERGQTSNSEDVFFPIAEEDWGKITKVGVYDAETNGNLLFIAAADYVKDINISSQYKIPRNYMIIRLV